MLPIRSGGQNRAIMSNALPMARLLLIEYCSAWKKSQTQHQMISANGNTANVAVRGSEFFPPDSAINATKTRPRVHNPKKKIPTPPAISISLRTSSSIFFPLALLTFAFHQPFFMPSRLYADFIMKNVSTSASTVGRAEASSFKPWNSTVLR